MIVINNFVLGTTLKLTLIHPCLGRIPGKKYIKSWQMEPLPLAYIAALTPKDVEIAFWDDRMEDIPYDVPTDLVAISVETYTAKRAYQIASGYRKRGVPVVMGGFHATLLPEEVSEYAEATVIGEAEATWPAVIEDFKNGKLKKFYKNESRPTSIDVIPDRSIFKEKKYLPVVLIEASRGCNFSCDFCAIQTAFNATQTRRSVENIVKEIKMLDRKKLYFFVDDNIVSDLGAARELFKAMIPLKIRWVSQASINMTSDDELLQLMKDSGCQGVLIGLESLNDENLKLMNKEFNAGREGITKAVEKLNKFGIRLYATFVFGREYDTYESFEDTIKFGIDHKIFMLAFNHLTPFPETPFYKQLEANGKLLYDQWWLDDRYKYGQVPFKLSLDPTVIQDECVKARKKFYGIGSIFKRMFSRTNSSNFLMFHAYLFINSLLKKEASQREDYPLGDLAFKGGLIKVGSTNIEENV